MILPFFVVFPTWLLVHLYHIVDPKSYLKVGILFYSISLKETKFLLSNCALTSLYFITSEQGSVVLQAARHPCLEVQNEIAFIPNDITLNRGKEFYS